MMQEKSLSRCEIGGVFHPSIGDRVYLASSSAAKEMMAAHKDWHFFRADNVQYIPFCQDFGPFNLADVHEFIALLKLKLAKFPNQTLVFCVDDLRRNITNGVFLLGCYLILAVGLSPESTWSCFESLSSIILPYRDATFEQSDFELSVLDCWSGLSKAKNLGWIDQIDLEEYIHYDNALEGDLHVIVPGKLIVFKGPETIEGQDYQDRDGRRYFSPSFYGYAFADMNVSTVVRLNARQYQDEEFEAIGVSCVGLEYDDVVPTPDVVTAFLHTMRTAAGAVAVHCRASLGRTGTLCALHLILSHGFTAREAIAWVRIIRPGSVLGEQQHYLANLESMVSLLQFGAASPPPPPPPPPRSQPLPPCAAAAAFVDCCHGASSSSSPALALTDSDEAADPAGGGAACCPNCDSESSAELECGRDRAAASCRSRDDPSQSESNTASKSTVHWQAQVQVQSQPRPALVGAPAAAGTAPPTFPKAPAAAAFPDMAGRLGGVIQQAVHRISEDRRRLLAPPCSRHRYQSSY